MQKKLYVAALSVVCLSVFSCGTSNKQSKTMGGYYFANQLDKVIDTTFEYNLFSKNEGFKPFSIVLPDSLGGNTVTGGVDIYTLIDEQKKIIAIQVIELFLLKNKKKFLNYNSRTDKEPLNSKYYQQLKNYLNHHIKSVPFIQRKEAAKGNHYTFCSINFSEW
jgi:hypothetical protein